MKNIWSILLIALIGISPFATKATPSLWENSKEGQSRFYDSKDLQTMQATALKLTSYQISAIEDFNQRLSLTPPPRACSDSFYIEYKLIAEDYGKLPFNFEQFLIYLRDQNKIDDVIYEQAKLYGDIASRTRPKKPSFFVSSIGLDKPKLEPVFEMAETLWQNAECPDSLLRMVYSRLHKVRGKKLSRRYLRKANHYAIKSNLISKELFKFLEKARREKAYKQNINLKDYLVKKALVARQFPFTEDHSDYVSKKLKKEKFSRRQSIYQKYSHFQIALMANLMEKLRLRMEAAAVDIVVRDEDGATIETIPLEPMEQYRFAVKMLRKEMDKLTNGSFFNGVTIDYFDVIAAAHEAGKVNSVEIDELVKLEDIWNPKKSLKEKIVDIVVRYGGITAVLLPPGYNLIPMLAIMIIEATTKEVKREDDNAFSLF